MRKKLRKHTTSFLTRIVLVFCVLGILATNLTYAKQQRTVKVAFFPMDGYHILQEDGTYSGMDADYLNVLCRYAPWNIEFVPCESWDDALTKLSNHEVDLVGTAQYSEARAAVYDYADLSSGYTYGIIATKSDSTVAFEDFNAMRDLTFGMVRTYVRRNEFLQYLADNGIQAPKLREYDNTQLLQEALNSGEIDALVHTFMEVQEGQRMIGRFAPKPIYYITWKGNDQVLRELNAALADLKFNHPELESELMQHYYDSKLDKAVLLTTAEKNYLEQKKVLTVGYLDGHYPFSYTNPETGEFAGLSRNLLEEALLWTGIELTYRRFETHEKAHQALSAGEIDLQAFCLQPEEGAESTHTRALKSYAELPLVLVTKDNKSFENIRSLATIAGFASLADQIPGLTPDNITKTHSQKNCLDLLNDNGVDAALCDGYLAESYIRTVWQYHDLTISTVLNLTHTAHMIVRQSEDPALENILAKTISGIDIKDISDYTFEKNTYPLMTLNTFLRNNSLVIVTLLLVLIALIITVATHMVRDSVRIQHLMYKDPTMDTWNMNYLYFKGEPRLHSDRRDNYAIVSINISKLRSYNIIYGWEAGQHLLEVTKDTLEKCINEKKEICARNYAGRFILLLTWTNWAAFMERLEQIQLLVEEIIFSKTETRMMIPMGIYKVQPGERSLRKAVNCASQVMELAMNKNDYEHHIAVYDQPVETMMTERHKREKLLESVDISEHFVAFYQNKVDIRTNTIVGAEALVRFLDPTANGAVRSPAYFVSYYEQTGRIVELDFAVMESVCRMLRKRLDEGKKVVPVSVNFSRMHFAKPGFPDHFEKMLDQYGISKDMVEVEITETLVMEELEQNTIKDTLSTLKERGVRLSIDDFGAGYSSLGSFVHVPANTIKLDRSFLINNENRTRQLKIMHGIVKMSEALDAEIVCEGVETEEDLEVMRKIEAIIAQGYYFSKPQPQHMFEAQLDEQYATSA